MKKAVLSIVAALVALTGIIWILQGVGILPGSFMTNQIIWAVIGAVMLVLAVGLFWFGNRPTSAKSE